MAFVASNLALNNGSDAVILKDFDGTELDRIDYDEDAGWVVEAGVALQLDPACSGTGTEQRCLSLVRGVPSLRTGRPGNSGRVQSILWRGRNRKRRGRRRGWKRSRKVVYQRNRG